MIACNSIKRLYTVFTEAKPKIEKTYGDKDVQRIYFDRVGYLYPSTESVVTITDDTLRYFDSRWARYYQYHPNNYQKICKFYNVNAEPISDNVYAFDVPLQTAIINAKLILLMKNQKTKN